MEPLWLPPGPYEAGWALGWHTVSSGLRTSIGERLYLLKYQHDRSHIEPLARGLAEVLSTRIVRPRLEAIVPIPPSNTERPFQPVLELARCLAQLTGIPLVEDYLVKVKPTPMLKNIESATGRRQELEGASTSVIRTVWLAPGCCFSMICTRPARRSRQRRRRSRSRVTWRGYMLWSLREHVPAHRTEDMKQEAERRQPWLLLTESDPLWPFVQWPFPKWPFSSSRPSRQANDDVGKPTGENLRCLWLMGPADLLHPDIPKVAIIGTRHPEPDIEEHVRQLARKIAERGYVIVSGFAPGIDRAAFEGALEAENGRTIAVLAEGIDWQRLPRRLRDIQRDPRYRSRVLIVSPFSPSTPWSGKNAMLRNLLIVALANIVLVGQAGPEETPREQSNRPRKSGTWHAVRKANEIRRRVIVPQSSLSVDHSQELVQRGLAVAWAEDLSELERLLGGSNDVRSDGMLVNESAFRTAFDKPSPVSHASSLAPPRTTQPLRNPGERAAGATDKAQYQQASLPGTCEGVAARQKDARSDDRGAERRSE